MTNVVIKGLGQSRLAGLGNLQLGYLALALALYLFSAIPIVIWTALGPDGGSLLAAIPAVVTVVLALFLGLNHIRAAIVLLILILPWQPLLTMPFADVLGASGVKVVVATKELYVVALLAALLVRNGARVPVKPLDVMALIFLMTYILGFLISPASLTARVVSLREGVMIVSFFLLGRLLLFDTKGVRRLLEVTIILLLPVLLFGYAEYFLFGELTWEELGVFSYFDAKWGQGSLQIRNVDHLPHNWTTYISGGSYRRMVGPVGDAPTLGRLMTLPVLALFYLTTLFGRPQQTFPLRLFLLLLFTGGAVLALGRGGMLIILFGLFVWALYRRPLLTLGIGLPVIFAAITVLPIFDIGSGSPARHLERTLIGVRSIAVAPLGHGLGLGGQRAALFAQNVNLDIQESFLGGLSFQLGLPAVAFYLLFTLALALSLFNTFRRNARETGSRRELAIMALLAFSLVGGIVGTSLVSNSAVSPISSGLSLLYSGAVVTAAQIARLPSSAED
jgi:hypothetical protein